MKRIIGIVTVLLLTVNFIINAQTYLYISKKNSAIVDSTLLDNIDNIYFKTYNSQIPTQGLVAWYPFNGTYKDSSNNNNNGVPTGGCSFTKDRFGNASKALFLDGTGYVTIPSSVSLDLRSSLTLAVWFKSNKLDQFNQLIYRGDPTPIQDPYWIRVYSNSIMFERDYLPTGSPTVTYPLGTVDTAKYHFYVGTYDSSNGSMRIYFDGMLVKEEFHKASMTYSTSQMFNVIGGVDKSPGCYGAIDDPRIYNRALSADEISFLYHENGW